MIKQILEDLINRGPSFITGSPQIKLFDETDRTKFRRIGDHLVKLVNISQTFYSGRGGLANEMSQNAGKAEDIARHEGVDTSLASVQQYLLAQAAICYALANSLEVDRSLVIPMLKFLAEYNKRHQE